MVAEKIKAMKDNTSPGVDGIQACIATLFKKGSINKSDNYRPVSLTTVMCILLERLTNNHMMDFHAKHQ